VRRRLRVLVLCAEIGEGHVTVARSLAAGLQADERVEAVELRTDLEVMGRRFGRFMTGGFHVHLDGIGWTYELAYRIFFERRIPRAAGQLALAALGGRGLKRTIAEFRADVVVTEYPVLSAALGQLRALGRMPVPVCSSISDPAGLYYWAHPGIDLHLLAWPEAQAEVDRIAGPGRAVPVRPPIDPRFLEPLPTDEARTRLQLPPAGAGRVVVVSGGGWGLGDLTGAVEIALTTGGAERTSAPSGAAGAAGAAGEMTVIVLAGRSDAAARRLHQRFDDDPRVRVVGFTEQMPELLAAADALIHTTGGTTALEARVSGCPLINYGTGVAHVRAHARALAKLGVAEWAPDRAALPAVLTRALAAGRREPLDVAALPPAADLIIELGLR
jgi:processive 1,2-diacylglycerol beta-glucosyltransferase